MSEPSEKDDDSVSKDDASQGPRVNEEDASSR